MSRESISREPMMLSTSEIHTTAGRHEVAIRVMTDTSTHIVTSQVHVLSTQSGQRSSNEAVGKHGSSVTLPMIHSA